MREAAILLLGLALAGCDLIGLGPPPSCNFGDAALAYHANTTLAEAGLAASGDPHADEPGELWVTADAVLLPRAAPDFSQPPSARPTARMYCFHPDGGNLTIIAPLPDGWNPPG